MGTPGSCCTFPLLLDRTAGCGGACDGRAEGGKGRGREGQLEVEGGLNGGQAEVDGWAGGGEGMWREVQAEVEGRAGRGEGRLRTGQVEVEGRTRAGGNGPVAALAGWQGSVGDRGGRSFSSSLPSEKKNDTPVTRAL